jgi:hypothetical protein
MSIADNGMFIAIAHPFDRFGDHVFISICNALLPRCASTLFNALDFELVNLMKAED